MIQKAASMLTLLLVLTTLRGSFIHVRVSATESYKLIRVPQDHSTIQEAINAANSSDTVFVSAGTYYESLTINKSITLQGESANNTVIHGNNTAWNVIQVLADYVSIRGFLVRNGTYGIEVNRSKHVTISECIVCLNWWYGIDLTDSWYNLICNNEIRDNYQLHIYFSTGDGVTLLNSSYNTIDSNIIRNYAKIGINLLNSHTNVIKHSIIETNVGELLLDPPTSGISLESSDSNLITHNTIGGYCLPIYCQEQSSNNRFVGNIFNRSADSIITGADNTFYANNFQRSNVSLYALNTWDNGAIGNYWHFYDGSDANGDGVGDTPCSLGASNVDRYPLMEPWKEDWRFEVFWDGKSYELGVGCNATKLTNMTFDQPSKCLDFNITNPSNSAAACNVTIPLSLMWGYFSVLIGDVPQSFAIYENSTHTSIYFIVPTSGTRQVKVLSTEVVHEHVPIEIILLLTVLFLPTTARKRRLCSRQARISRL